MPGASASFMTSSVWASGQKMQTHPMKEWMTIAPLALHCKGLRLAKKAVHGIGGDCNDLVGDNSALSLKRQAFDGFTAAAQLDLLK